MPTLSELHDVKEIINRIREFGGSASKTRIKNSMTMDLNRFELALQKGIESENLKREFGNEYSIIKDVKILESDYYSEVERSIIIQWKKDKYGEADFHLENTSNKDSKIVGQWTRPDFTLVSIKKFPWTFEKEFDVVTFEVKRPEKSDVLAVFEALSHLSVASKAYVVFPLDLSEWERQNPEQSKRVREECTRHGIGLILIEDIFGSAQPNQIIKATRRQIDNEKCSNFLGSVLSTKGKEMIAAWK